MPQAPSVSSKARSTKCRATRMSASRRKLASDLASDRQNFSFDPPISRHTERCRQRARFSAPSHCHTRRPKQSATTSPSPRRVPTVCASGTPAGQQPVPSPPAAGSAPANGRASCPWPTDAPARRAPDHRDGSPDPNAPPRERFPARRPVRAATTADARARTGHGIGETQPFPPQAVDHGRRHLAFGAGFHVIGNARLPATGGIGEPFLRNIPCLSGCLPRCTTHGMVGG